MVIIQMELQGFVTSAGPYIVQEWSIFATNNTGPFHNDIILYVWCHLVPNCTVAQPVTTSVDSVQLIWEGMHEANGAGRRQGGLASGVGDAVTPRAPVWHTVAAHVGAADDATRNTPNAVCIPQTQQPREGRAGRHKDAATDRSGHTT